MRESDEAALALTAEGSRAIADTLADQPVVLVTPTQTPQGPAEVLLDILGNAGASVVGTLELQPGLSPETSADQLSESDVGALRAAVGAPAGDNSDVATPDEAAPEELAAVARLLLAESLAALSVEPVPKGDGEDALSSAEGSGPAVGSVPSEEPATSEGTGTAGEPGSVAEPEEPGDGVDPSEPTAVDEARAVLERFAQAGLISIDGAGLPADSAFPATAGVRYVTVLAVDSDPGGSSWVVPFVEDYGAASGATMLVSAVDQPRGAGELPDDPGSAGALTELLEPLRSGPASNEVSTVEAATEPLPRLAVIYGLQAQVEGVVGHYGLGDDVTAPFPPTVQE